MKTYACDSEILNDGDFVAYGNNARKARINEALLDQKCSICSWGDTPRRSSSRSRSGLM
jgi:hypothetical protein